MLPKPVGRLEGKAVWRPGLRSESDRAAPAAPNSGLLLALGCWGLGVFDVVWIHSRSLDSVSWLCGISFTATKHKLNTEMLVFLGQMSMCWSLQRKTSMDTQLCLLLYSFCLTESSGFSLSVSSYCAFIGDGQQLVRVLGTRAFVQLWSFLTVPRPSAGCWVLLNSKQLFFLNFSPSS